MSRKIIIALLLVVLITTRLYRLDQPPKHYFDEVYHAFTAQEMSKGNPAAWEWWNLAPAGFAYEWTHPPLAKLAMVVGIKLLPDQATGWRLPGAILGVILAWVIYGLVKQIAGDKAALLAVFLYTFDGMSLVMARIGMNDIYLVFFLFLSLWLLVSKRPLWASLVYGLALASKWSGVYFAPIWLYFLWRQRRLKYLILPVLVYLLAYTPFWVQGHTWSQFVQLQKQMWWYHTGLKATHSYSSPAWSWPIMLRPVWAHVQYLPDTIANIYIQGNPIVWWVGILGLVYALYQRKYILPISGYALFWLPWLASPRIMFLYHYFPSVTFLYMLLALGLAQVQQRFWVGLFCLAVVVSFVYFFPHWTGMVVPTQLANSYYWLKSWK